MTHAVKYWNDDRPWPDGGREIIERAGEVVAFYAQKDDVIRRRNLSCCYYLGPYGEIAIVWAENPQSLSPDLLASFCTNEKGYVTACLCQASSKIAANCSSADD